ncbi:M15 family metallopeptidase [Planctomicrobium sp. SH661]|uniref:M15 family metallopeptidase n=1 Tax=Planctomicrobium sp. SH661 TaxID=3448124 RepID=UPI003F5AEEB5
MISTDREEERAYWTEQMQLGYEFVEKLLQFEVVECGERFASIEAAADAASVEMLFSTTKIAGDLERVHWLRERLVEDVITIGREMNQRGWILKIEDAFRSLKMQQLLVRKPAVFDMILKQCIWENEGVVPPVEQVFRRAIVLVANIPKIGTHLSGSAIDISVFNRDDGTEVWRGNPYLEMSEQTPMASPFVGAADLRNRIAITALMESHGFYHYPFEFWHYSKGDAMEHLLSGNPDPARYGPVNWNPQTNEVTPVASPMIPLNPLPVIEKEINEAIERIGNGSASWC